MTTSFYDDLSRSPWTQLILVPQVDYAKFAELAGLTTTASGASTWAQLNKKLARAAAPVTSANVAEGDEEVTPGPVGKKRVRKAENKEPKTSKKRAKKTVPKTEEGDNNVLTLGPPFGQPLPLHPHEEGNNDLSSLGLSPRGEVTPEATRMEIATEEGENALSPPVKEEEQS